MFRESNPDSGETASQFVAKLQIYFTRWMQLAKVDEEDVSLEDMMLRDQFISICHEDWAMFLGERMPELTNIEKMAHVAEQYTEAHSCTLTRKYKKKGDSKPGQGW